MLISHRYGIVLAVIAAYYAHFFIPIFSLTTSAPVSGGGMPGLEFLQGFAVYDYHYLSIGIMPFIFSSLVLQLIKWQIPDLFDKISGGDGQAEWFQKISTYVIASIMALVIVIKMPEERFLFHASLTFVELILTIASIEQLIKLLKPLNVISSPVMLFLGLNVFSSLVYNTATLPYGLFDVVMWSQFALTLFLGALTVVLVYYSFKWKNDVVIGKAFNMSGAMSTKRIPYKVLRSGVSPVIYVSFLFFPLVAWLYQEAPQKILIQEPWLIVLFFLMTGYFSKSLNKMNVRMDSLVEFGHLNALVVCDEEKVSLKDRLSIMTSRNAWLGGVWFTSLITTEALWMTLGDRTFSGVGFVGGISVVLIMNVVLDLSKNYKTIREFNYV